MQKKKADFIIIGQGLAGTLLAHELIERGKSVIVFDKPELSQASKIAAGIWNPVVFKRLTKSWMIDRLLPKMTDRYEKIASRLGVDSFVSAKQYFKIITSENEKIFWQSKASSEMSTYLCAEIKNVKLKKNYEVGEVVNAGNLDIKRFLDQSRNFFQKKNILLEDALDYSQILFKENEIEINSSTADKIIFCEGHKITQNPFFNFVAMKPVKGEIVTIKSESLFTEAIINKGIFILPLKQKGFYKVGATYNWEELSDIPTKEGTESILSKLREIIDASFEVMQVDAGVRPSVSDRRPIIGKHPTNEKLWVFNGLGTKGVMIGPYFAELTANAICDNQSIPEEVNVERFL